MDFFKKYMYPLLTGIGILAALLFFSLNVPHNREANVIERTVLNILSPLLQPASRISSFVEDIWDSYIQLVDTHRENLRLREDIRSLNLRVQKENETLLANQRLEKLLRGRQRHARVAIAMRNQDWRGHLPGVRER